MKTLMFGGLIAVLAAGLVMPAQTLAGDKEWATAGKILAGVVAFGVLTDGLQSDSCRTTERVVVREVYRPPVVVHQVYRPPVVVRQVYRPAVVYESCRSYRTGGCRAHRPIIRYYGRNRHIAQPRLHGHPGMGRRGWPRGEYRGSRRSGRSRR